MAQLTILRAFVQAAPSASPPSRACLNSPCLLGPRLNRLEPPTIQLSICFCGSCDPRHLFPTLGHQPLARLTWVLLAGGAMHRAWHTHTSCCWTKKLPCTPCAGGGIWCAGLLGDARERAPTRASSDQDSRSSSDRPHLPGRGQAPFALHCWDAHSPGSQRTKQGSPRQTWISWLPC